MIKFGIFNFNTVNVNNDARKKNRSKSIFQMNFFEKKKVEKKTEIENLVTICVSILEYDHLYF